MFNLILAALQWFIEHLVYFMLPMHTNSGVVGAISNGTSVVLEILWVPFTVLNLQFAATCMAVVITIWLLSKAVGGIMYILYVLRLIKGLIFA